MTHRLVPKFSAADLLNSSNFYYAYGVEPFNRIMSTWEQEKDKCLKQQPEAKQKDCIKLETVQTWKDFAESVKLPDPIEMLENCAINISKNEVLSRKISIFEGDITKLAVDAIVNAANETLMGGGGVDGAIHRAAGPTLKEECKTLGGCEIGEAKISGGYQLPSRYIIHTVGPRGEKPAKLRKCYENSLNLLVAKNLRTIAFPCISTGIFGYPNLAAAHVAAYQVRRFLEDNTDAVDRVLFCLFLEKDRKIYEGILQSYFPVSH